MNQTHYSRIPNPPSRPSSLISGRRTDQSQVRAAMSKMRPTVPQSKQRSATFRVSRPIRIWFRSMIQLLMLQNRGEHWRQNEPKTKSSARIFRIHKELPLRQIFRRQAKIQKSLTRKNRPYCLSSLTGQACGVSNWKGRGEVDFQTGHSKKPAK